MAEEYIIGSGKGRGGWRNGGRKKGIKIGSNTERTEQFTKRITPEEKIKLEKYLEELRKGQ